MSSDSSSVLGVLHVVPDLERTCAFYTGLLGFHHKGSSELSGPECDALFRLEGVRALVAHLVLGDESLYLLEFVSHRGEPYPIDSHSNDLWFQHLAIVVSDMAKSFAILEKNGVSGISAGPQMIPAWNTAAAGIEAYYFNTPNRHPLELISFPDGKGRDLWHAGSKDLFLGIDHTAIAVSDIAASLAFYRDLLGMHVVGQSLNYGETQERLSGVPGARVEIVGLRFDSPRGMGIEFLHYLEPSGGRNKPPDTPTYHLTETTTIVAVSDFDRIAREAGPAVRSGRISALGAPFNFDRCLIVSDPDGHRLLLTENR